MNKKIKIYVASPLGFSEVGKEFMYSKIIPTIQELNYEVLDPWKLTDEKLINSILKLSYGIERKKAWEKLNPIIGSNNEKAIKIARGLVAVLDGVDIDSGTSSEIGFATALGKPTLGYKGDFRLTSDNEGSLINLQVEHFIKSRGGKIITQISDLKKELKNIFY
jgi:nucleoside 2-deoxyribosyltransferase